MKLILCSDCDSFHIDARDLLGSWAYLHVVVNHNQNYLGKMMLVLRRHATERLREQGIDDGGVTA